MDLQQLILKLQQALQTGDKDDLALLNILHEFLDKEVRPNFTVRDLLMAALLKVRNKEGLLVPFVANEAQKQIAANWSDRNIVLKARQLGMTTYVAARFFVDTITRPGTLTVQVAHDQRSAEAIFRIVHRFQENLPKALREGALKTSRANMRQLVWPRLDCEYRVETAGDPNAGRGCTIRNLHCSEVAMWPRDGAEAMASLRAAVPPGGQIVMESTPNGAGGGFYEEWQRAEETGFVRHFLPWWLEHRYRVPGVGAGELNQEEQSLIEKHGLDDEQIVYRRQLRADHRTRMPQEYAEDPESCFLASGECAFEIDVVEKRLNEVEPIVGEDRNGSCRNPLTIFMPPVEKKHYIIGVDPAGGGVNGDYACAQVIDRESGMQCAELHGHFTPHEMARKVADLGRDYNDALIVVEKNAMGGAVLSPLEHVIAYEKLYRHNGQTGLTTTAANRPEMIENLGAVMSATPSLFNSGKLLRECRTFVRQADGSPRAASGSHDDTVMAMAIAQHVRRL